MILKISEEYVDDKLERRRQLVEEVIDRLTGGEPHPPYQITMNTKIFVPVYVYKKIEAIDDYPFVYPNSSLPHDQMEITEYY